MLKNTLLAFYFVNDFSWYKYVVDVSEIYDRFRVAVKDSVL